eukprot:TRINITY_DN55045_c0_g1_i1.p1 TRINITY_DN55045_c0_g1~~TRINITY_DN55045_c0_g1_i1.p1  ORF type:complete len:500 (+),score=20.74 TRINITY_DN55045_c0_g1_i1:110-1501(+)
MMATLQDIVAPPRSIAPTWLCCSLSTLILIACVGAAFSGFDFKASKPSGRSPLLDNGRLFVQVFVVWNHWHGMISRGWVPDAETWLKGAGPFVAAMEQALQHFTMPTACFISGMCSQGVANRKRVKSYIMYLVIPSLLWMCFFRALIFGKLHTKPYQLQNHTLHLPQFTFEGEWYLSALVLWRGFVFVCPMATRPRLLLACAVFASLAGGYFKFGLSYFHGPVPFELLQLGCACSYFPFFALGYVFPFQRFSESLPVVSWRFRLLTCLGLAVFTLVVCPRMDPMADPHWSYETSRWDSHAPDHFTSLDVKLFWTRRLLRIATDLGIMFLVFLIIPREENCLTWAGEYTLYSYLFHQLALKMRANVLFHYSPYQIQESESPLVHFLVYVLNFGFVVMAVLFFASSCWRWLFSWLFKPDWLRPAYDKIEDVVLRMVGCMSSKSVDASSTFEATKDERELLAAASN